MPDMQKLLRGELRTITPAMQQKIDELNPDFEKLFTDRPGDSRNTDTRRSQPGRKRRRLAKPAGRTEDIESIESEVIRNGAETSVPQDIPKNLTLRDKLKDRLEIHEEKAAIRRAKARRERIEEDRGINVYEDGTLATHLRRRGKHLDHEMTKLGLPWEWTQNISNKSKRQWARAVRDEVQEKIEKMGVKVNVNSRRRWAPQKKFKLSMVSEGDAKKIDDHGFFVGEQVSRFRQRMQTAIEDALHIAVPNLGNHVVARSLVSVVDVHVDKSLTRARVLYRPTVVELEGDLDELQRQLFMNSSKLNSAVRKATGLQRIPPLVFVPDISEEEIGEDFDEHEVEEHSEDLQMFAEEHGSDATKKSNAYGRHQKGGVVNSGVGQCRPDHSDAQTILPTGRLDQKRLYARSSSAADPELTRRITLEVASGVSKEKEGQSWLSPISLFRAWRPMVDRKLARMTKEQREGRQTAHDELTRYFMINFMVMAAKERSDIALEHYLDAHLEHLDDETILNLFDKSFSGEERAQIAHDANEAADKKITELDILFAREDRDTFPRVNFVIETEKDEDSEKKLQEAKEKLAIPTDEPTYLMTVGQLQLFLPVAQVLKYQPFIEAYDALEAEARRFLLERAREFNPDTYKRVNIKAKKELNALKKLAEFKRINIPTKLQIERHISEQLDKHDTKGSSPLAPLSAGRRKLARFRKHERSRESRDRETDLFGGLDDNVVYDRDAQPRYRDVNPRAEAAKEDAETREVLASIRVRERLLVPVAKQVECEEYVKAADLVKEFTERMYSAQSLDIEALSTANELFAGLHAAEGALKEACIKAGVRLPSDAEYQAEVAKEMRDREN
eukprot:Clim_evm32s108 gene=Clim_evmTU32s108